MTEREQLEAAIAVLQAQRALLGDSVVDTALGPLREQLARLAPAEQRLKHVSVLFMDIVGSTSLSEHLDPEEVHAVVDDVLARCTDIVRQHGGKVLQYAGDNLLAAFGTEQALEDDAERAVGCALALLQQGHELEQRVLARYAHQGCQVRVGIHTGPVLLGGGVDEDGSIRGLTVNIAARMEQTAPAGTVRISHATWLQVRGAFDADAQPPLEVRGHDEPLTTYLVRRARPREQRVTARGIEDLPTPLVGRESELRQLGAAFDDVTRAGRSRSVAIVGEPGLGKSRLLREWLGALKERSPQPRLLTGRAQPSSRQQPYGLLHDLLARLLNIADSDTAQVARVKLVDGVVPWLEAAGAEVPALARVHALGQLLGMDFGASAHLRDVTPLELRRRGFAALHDLLHGLAHGGATAVVLLEDLHWADDASLDFVAEAIASAPACRLLLVATARPEVLERRPGWGRPQDDDAAAASTLVVLAPLDDTQGEQLSRALLDRLDPAEPGHARALHDLLTREARGNPFYMEELLRMVRDDGVIVVRPAAGAREVWHVRTDLLATLRVPGTLVGVLQARLDALHLAQRRSLQQASIVGPMFWDAALGRIDPRAPDALDSLCRKALIERHATSTFDDTVEWAFAHHLLQQAAYDTVLRAERQAGHAAAAQWFAERALDRPAEYLAETAEHYERAGDHERAFTFLCRAAEDASRRYANAAALDYNARALASPAATDPRQRAVLLRHRARIADLLGMTAEQRQAVIAFEAVAQSLGDEHLEAEAVFARALVASREHDEAAAVETARRAAVLAERSGHHDIAAQALAQVAWSLYEQESMDAAHDHAARAVERIRLARAQEDTGWRRELEVQLLTMRAAAERGGGRFAAARSTLDEALARAEDGSMVRPRVAIHEWRATIARDVGDHASALEQHRISGQIAGRIGWTGRALSARAGMAAALFELARADEARDILTEARVQAEAIDDRKTLGECLLLQARLDASSGDDASAERNFDAAGSAFAACDSVHLRGGALAHRAQWRLSSGDLPGAMALADELAATLPTNTSLAAADQPLFARWVCHRIWAACGDARAGPTLEALRVALMALVDRCGDNDLREALLRDVPLHRDILAAAG